MHFSTKNQNIYLAPMEDVSDFPFRQVLLKIGRPDVFFTEFVNVDGFTSKKGGAHVRHRLEKNQNQEPIVAQFWGNKPEKFVESAKVIKDMGFQGIDINLGCPVKKVLKVGCGSALIGNYDIVEKTVKLIQDLSLDIPLSVKTRIGTEKFSEEWISFLLKLKLDCIFIHGRTAKQVFSGQADWDAIGEVVKLKNVHSPSTKIVGNGDVKSVKQAVEFKEKYGVDGIMIGREVMKNPWVFSEKIPEKKERIETLFYHMEEMKKFVEKFPDKGWSSIKKFYHGYLREDEELTSLRNELFEKTSLEESIALIGGGRG
jgi:nifR3 family TIM-barrel protein